MYLLHKPVIGVGMHAVKGVTANSGVYRLEHFVAKLLQDTLHTSKLFANKCRSCRVTDNNTCQLSTGIFEPPVLADKPAMIQNITS